MLGGDDMAVFKAYLRNLMRQLQALKKALDNNDIETAQNILKELTEDTQNSIED